MPEISRQGFDDKHEQAPAVSGQKIGILTFHRCINYGSYWQTRCLVDGLRARGYNVAVLDHRSPGVDIAEWRVALQPTLPTPVPKEDVEQYACKVRKFLAAFEKLPLSKEFDLDDPSHLDPVDTVVIGSDEVWNLWHPWYASRPAFFGVGLPANRVVTYAASFGNYSCWEGIGSPWTDFLGRLDDVSVRDENSYWMLKNSLGLETDIVLDPCLQFPHEPEGPWKGPAGPYALVYGHNFSPQFADQVRGWADDRRLPLLSIGYRNDWADHQWLAAGPEDFCHAMSRATAVATNFFHGCVFALQHEKPFGCEVSAYRSIKVRGLMELVGGEAHLVEESHHINKLLSEPINPAILSRIVDVRHTGDTYLVRALTEANGRQVA
jgi:hypothetical protein